MIDRQYIPNEPQRVLTPNELPTLGPVATSCLVLDIDHNHWTERQGLARNEGHDIAKQKRRARNKRHYLAHKAQYAAYYKAHKAERAAYYQAYRAENIVQIEAYRQAHKAEIATRQKAYYRDHKADILAHAKVYRQTHKDEKDASNKAYQRSHRAEFAAYCKAYQQDHPDKIVDISARHRARKLNATVEQVSRAVVYERDAGRCHLCGGKVNPRGWHLDHIIPLARDGEHSYRNVAVSCPKCNMSKGTKGGAQLRLY